MILQTVILPSKICEEEALYIRNCSENKEFETFFYDRDILYLKKGTEITTDTYMNIFDAAQWENFTEISANNWRTHICYEGNAVIRLMKNEHIFFLYIKAISDVVVYFMRYESVIETVQKLIPADSAGNRQENQNHAGCEACTHHLYLSPRDAIEKKSTNTF